MKPYRFLALASAFVLPFAGASADAPESPHAALIREMEAIRQAESIYDDSRSDAIRAPARGDSDASPAPDAQAASQMDFANADDLKNLDDWLRGEEYVQCIHQVSHFAHDSHTEKFKKLWSDLLVSLQAALDQQNAYVQKLSDTCCRKAAAAVASDAKPEEILHLKDELADESSESLRSVDSAAVVRAQQELTGASEFLARWLEVLTAVADGRNSDALNELNTMGNGSQQPYRAVMSFLPPGKLEETGRAIQKKAAEQARKILEEASAAAAKASSPADFNRVIDILSKGENLFNQFTGDATRQYVNDFGNRRDEMHAWLRVLESEASGDIPGAIRNLSSYTTVYGQRQPWIDSVTLKTARIRLTKALLEKAIPPPEADPAELEIVTRLEKVATPDELQSLGNQLTQVGGTLFHDQDPQIAQFLEELRSLRLVWIAVNSGQFSEAWERPPAPVNPFLPRAKESWEIPVRALRARILAQAIAGEWKFPPLDGKTPGASLEKLAGDARLKSDWPHVLEILGAEQALAKGMAMGTGAQPALDDEMGGVRDYLSGQNLEQASQWAEAARAYHRVVARLADGLPRADATARLAALAREHPDSMATIAR